MSDKNHFITDQSFKRNERLRSKKHVGELFAANQFFFLYPFKIFHQQKKDKTGNLQVLIAVPRRNHKNAADRNKIKRLVREAWRKNKKLLITPLHKHNKTIDVGIIYTSRGTPTYKEIEDKIILILQRLKKVHADS